MTTIGIVWVVNRNIEQERAPVTIIDPSSSRLWPERLLDCLCRYHDVLSGWECGTATISAALYDAAIDEIGDAIRPFGLVGWHCTRLTKAEIEEILRSGMHLPSEATLLARIDARVRDGELDQGIAQLLRRRHEAADIGRSGRICFMFFPPHVDGESGSERFFRHWGGEALYNCHEDDPVTSAALNAIGVPCVIETYVPIALLPRHSDFAAKIARRYLMDRGLSPQSSANHEDGIKVPLPARYIMQIIRHPSPEFSKLTGCKNWNHPVGTLRRIR